MNEVTIKGEVTHVDEVREYGANGFRKQEVVVETGDGKWANPIAVEFTKDHIEKSQTLKKGDRVTIEARVNGREWQGRDGVTKWFTSISAYKLETEGGNDGPAPALRLKLVCLLYTSPSPTVPPTTPTMSTGTGTTETNSSSSPSSGRPVSVVEASRFCAPVPRAP